MRHGKGAQIRVRLYLEGRYIPNGALSATVQGNDGGPATAEISLTPTNSIKHILPFTWVHLFVTDPWDLNPKGDLSDFKLLFEGVVVGPGYARENQGRGFVVHCADPSIFWVTAKQYWLNITSGSSGMMESVMTQSSMGAARVVAATATETGGIMMAKLAEIKEGDPERFMDSILASIDDVGSVNPYYFNTRNRFRITDRIIRAHCGEVEKLFLFSVMGPYLTELASKASGQTNLAEVVNLLLAPVLHHWVSVVAPPYVKARIFLRDTYGNIIRRSSPKTVEFKDGLKVTSKIFSYEMGIDHIIAGTIFKPDIYTLSPPTCNILYPNMYEHLGYRRNFLEETTRLTMWPSLIGFDPNTLRSVAFKFTRPTELELFESLTRNQKTSPVSPQKRTPDASYAGGANQTAAFHDYDWATNEERIRGIVYNQMNMAPAPAMLTLSSPGVTSGQTTKNGMPKYLQNVASYEFYKSKFASRQSSVQGPFNIRPVVGFPILIVDDSTAGMNILAHLQSITHIIEATGQATTSYGIALPRLADEIDYNRPNVMSKVDPVTKEVLFDQIKDEKGDFQFDKLFKGKNRPPIPEWFSDDWKTLKGLDATYKTFFGDNVGVMDYVQYRTTQGGSQSVNITENKLEDESLDQATSVKAIADRYRDARDKGREFEESSTLTWRDMTSIDQAFKFVGARPDEASQEPAETRQFDYAKSRFNRFVGDVSAGAGYNAQPEGKSPSATKNPSTVSTSTSTASVDQQKKPNYAMGPSFPLFDTKLHEGTEAEDSAARASAREKENTPTQYPRYDGRPVVHDFEWRIYKKSVTNVNAAMEAAATAADARFETSGGEVQKVSSVDRVDQAEAGKNAKDQKARKQSKAKQTANMKPSEQAPTGDLAEDTPVLPLPMPLAERQIVDLRRALVDTYLKELEGTRGFSG